MQEFIETWGYIGVFSAILATGFGFPVPEELPIVLGGAMSSHGGVDWYLMLPVCIVSVLLGDFVLYAIGRLWGGWLVQIQFIRKHVLTPERFQSIAENFQKYGVKLLLFARLTPGFRAPIFLTAGITRLPITYFLFADGIYAIPGVTLLFFLSYWFTDSVLELVNQASLVKPIIILVVLAGVAIYFLYRHYKKPMVTGNPTDMPPLVGPVTERLEEVVEKMGDMADKVLKLSKHPSAEEKAIEEEAAKKKAEEEAAKNGHVNPPIVGPEAQAREPDGRQ